jgi:hypothetical protein
LLAFWSALFNALLLFETPAFAAAALEPFFLLDRAMMSPHVSSPLFGFQPPQEPNGNSDTIPKFAHRIEFVNG